MSFRVRAAWSIGIAAFLFAFAIAATASARPPEPAQPPAAVPPAAAPADEGVVFVGAGDIANCDAPMNGAGARATAAVLDGIPGTVFTTGDHAYQTGSENDFKKCYDPTWGR